MLARTRAPFKLPRGLGVRPSCAALRTKISTSEHSLNSASPLLLTSQRDSDLRTRHARVLMKFDCILPLRKFLNSLPAVPFYRVGHRRHERIEFVTGTPADVVMLPGGKSHRPIFRASPVDHADVFVGVSNAMDI